LNQQHGKSKVFGSANALENITRPTRTKVAKRKVNDENKENCVATRVARSTTQGINGNSLNAKGKGKRVIGDKKVESKVGGRAPLKELPLNGFVDKLRKRHVSESVEVVVFYLQIITINCRVRLCRVWRRRAMETVNRRRGIDER